MKGKTFPLLDKAVTIHNLYHITFKFINNTKARKDKSEGKINLWVKVDTIK
jgi:hypothetical protein